MNRICLMALIGLPAAGKTSLCHQLMEMATLPFNILHLCYDFYVNFNLDAPTQYKDQREQLLQKLSLIIKKFKNTPQNITPETISIKDFYKDHQHKDLVILCDDNHYYRSMRYKLYQLARAENISFCQIYLETNLELALERNNERTGTENIPPDVVVEMSKRLETPNASIHKWEENTLILKDFHIVDNIRQDFIAFVTNCLEVPVQPLQLLVDKTQTPQSLVHELDLMMRKRITALMSSEVEKNKQIFAKNLNDKRRNLLKQFQLDMGDNFKDLDLNKYVEMLK